MQVRSSERQERRKRRTTEAILDAAERLLRERGWAAATIAAIAEEADVALGSIYARFRGKDGLLLALVDRALTVNEAAMAGAYASAGSPLAQVMAGGDAYLRFHLDHPHALRLVGLGDLERPADPEALARIDRRLRAMVSDLAARIAAAAAAGEARAVDPRATAMFLWGSWNGVVALHVRGVLSERALRRTLAEGRELVRRGLAPA